MLQIKVIKTMSLKKGSENRAFFNAFDEREDLFFYTKRKNLESGSQSLFTIDYVA